MRKVTRTVAMIALMFGALTVSANEGKLSSINTKNTKSVVFELDSKAGMTTIRLSDIDQNVIYFEEIDQVIYTKKFDLNSLKDGMYYFTTEDSLKTTTYTIKVAKSSVAILNKKEDRKPIFRKESGMVYLNLLNLDKGDVKIEVFDSSNRLVFSEKRENEMIVEKAFNFTNAFHDSYTVVVKEGNNTYYEIVKI